MNLNELIKLSSEQSYDTLVKKLESQDSTFKKQAVQIFTAIQNQDMETHQLIFLYCLQYMDIKTTFNIFDRFLKSLTNGKQICHKIDKLYKVADEYKKFMIENNLAIKAIKAFEFACRSLEKEKIGLTRMHSMFVELCLRAKMYKSALRIIDKPLIHLEVRSKIDEGDFYNFKYFCGCIFLGLKRYREAQDCFELVVQLHQKDLYQVTIDTCKKLFFLGIRSGETSLHKSISQMDVISNKLINVVLDVYKQSEKNLESFDQFVLMNEKELQKEGNLGLARQLRICFIIKELRKLMRVYTRFRIEKLDKEIKVNFKDIADLQSEINKVERLFKINRKLNCIEFNQGEDIDHREQVLIPLKNLFELLKSVKQEYEAENEKMIIERIQQPDVIVA
ncbi:COP9 signalosome complex subunit 3, putative (macronuclear) [Tetrahymena thermophila SB210]|uniref:COP9 signalosome complex subunit 3, putative n=1 Tax=Tetrahymena thermophila (strain SB210) TaxID=312017 RepID=Q22A25_TETTS|nr:COP9 signalosome complex subunit 3, putative [Tetrahymena thermophila SB210]EAR82154.2 COP9 signalosome complex subunit 3, putative [Tetrahymena thermophila SB210]|eukprot:XP_001029818.2 COP9 signalosome complex subunit 3, putative [Tetrahymena thermophila SB210]